MNPTIWPTNPRNTYQAYDKASIVRQKNLKFVSNTSIWDHQRALEKHRRATRPMLMNVGSPPSLLTKFRSAFWIPLKMAIYEASFLKVACKSNKGKEIKTSNTNKIQREFFQIYEHAAILLLRTTRHRQSWYFLGSYVFSMT